MEKKVLMNEILTLLNKVNRQAQILVHLPNMARIDVDLLLAEIRQVYDKTLDLQLKIETSRQQPKTEPKASQLPADLFESGSHSSVHTTPKLEEPLLFPETEISKPSRPADFELPQPEPVASPPPIVPAASLNPPSVCPPKSLHQVYEEQNPDHTIASRLQYNPIHDLRSAIGINDKFLLMNQLFKGSMEQYNAAIERLNDFYNYEDAEIFLGSLKILHDWAEDLPAIDKLLHFVKRRYQKE